MQNKTVQKIAVTEGFGVSIVVATEDLASGAFLAQYTGQVMNRQALEQRINEEHTKQQKLHVFPINKELVVDASLKGSICRYLSGFATWVD